MYVALFLNVYVYLFFPLIFVGFGADSVHHVNACRKICIHGKVGVYLFDRYLEVLF
jgi:hypothetical protein